MADFTALKTAITNAIKQNGNQAITGNLLQEILIAMVESMGDTALNNLATSIQTSLNSLSAVDGNLADAISSEASTRQSADNSLASAINSEALTRSQVDTTLQQNINTESNQRQSTDNSLQNQITVEKNARIDAVNRLQGLIDAINNVVGNGYTFGGVVKINDAPQQGKMFYIALERGNYINFGGASVHNGITLIYNNGQWIAKELLDLDVFYGEILRIVNAYQPIVIEGNVTNAPDEEDLTSNNIGLLQFKNKAYAPTIYSGLGRKYLRKNIRPLTDSASFDGFVENVESEASLSGTPEAIFWDRINERFVGKKDDVYYQDWTDSDDYVPVSSELVYMNEGTPYRWDGTDLIVYDEIYPDLINMLTQEMISDANTIYHIQYDYILGEDITVPANCVLEFDGGSISASGSNDTITGANTGISACLVKIFNTDVTLAGTWNVAEAYPEWFGGKGDGINDDTFALQKTLDTFSCVKLTSKSRYCISSPLTINKPVNLSGNYNSGTNYTVIAALAKIDCLIEIMPNGVRSSFENIYLDGKIDDNTFVECGFLTKQREYNTYYYQLSFKNIKIIFVDYGFNLNKVYSCTFDTCQCNSINKIGFAFNKDLTDGSECTTITCINCGSSTWFAEGGKGWFFKRLTYSNLISCGSDQNSIGYEFENCRNFSITGCGTEQGGTALYFTDYCSGFSILGFRITLPANTAPHDAHIYGQGMYNFVIGGFYIENNTKRTGDIFTSLGGSKIVVIDRMSITPQRCVLVGTAVFFPSWNIIYNDADNPSFVGQTKVLSNKVSVAIDNNGTLQWKDIYTEEKKIPTFSTNNTENGSGYYYKVGKVVFVQLKLTSKITSGSFYNMVTGLLYSAIGSGFTFDITDNDGNSVSAIAALSGDILQIKNAVQGETYRIKGFYLI